MEFDFFLWPMLLPLTLPISYSILYKRDRIGEILVITLSMILIVILYWPVSLWLHIDANIYSKFFLFVIIPIFLLYIYDRVHKYSFNSDEKIFDWNRFGINSEGFEKSLKLGLLFIPIMIIVTFLINYYHGIFYPGDIFIGSVYFVEAFTEEFLFRGILFLFLLKSTNIKIAYITSLASFILMHPQHLENYTNLFFISTIVQGVLTIEIARRSENITGAWLLHGINRFFIIVIIPLLLS